MIQYTKLEQDVIDFFQKIYNRVWTSEYTRDIVRGLKKQLRDYKNQNHLNGYVLPLSGGLDSAVVAALCEGILLETAFIDILSSKEHKEMAKKVAKQYKHSFKYINLLDEWKSVVNGMKHLVNENKLLEGNIKTRLRMITAYHMAGFHNSCVLSTDNFSEYNMGFWTLHGDVGDIAPIQFINKGFELPFVARELKVPTDIIKQKPSDGLNITFTNTDEAQIGANYKFVDACMMLYDSKKIGSINSAFDANEVKSLLEFREKIKVSDKYKKIIERYEKSSFKRNINFQNNIFKVTK